MGANSAITRITPKECSILDGGRRLFRNGKYWLTNVSLQAKQKSPEH
jgi:hypothetical protein